jgi:hypothetical protein
MVKKLINKFVSWVCFGTAGPPLDEIAARQVTEEDIKADLRQVANDLCKHPKYDRKTGELINPLKTALRGYRFKAHD